MKTLENRRGTMKNHENMNTGGNRWLRVVTGAFGWFWVITGNSKEEVMIFRYKQTNSHYVIMQPPSLCRLQVEVFHHGMP